MDLAREMFGLSTGPINCRSVFFCLDSSPAGGNCYSRLGRLEPEDTTSNPYIEHKSFSAVRVQRKYSDVILETHYICPWDGMIHIYVTNLA